MLLDRYTASYYQTRGKLKSLLTVKKLDLRRDIGVLFSKDTEALADCLNFIRPNIWTSVQTITETFKVPLDLSILTKICYRKTTPNPFRIPVALAVDRSLKREIYRST